MHARYDGRSTTFPSESHASGLRSPHILVPLLALAFAGCADHRPSLVREHLQQQVSSQSGGALAVSSLVKTNGFDHIREGMTLYNLEWEARLTVRTRTWKAGWNDFAVSSSQPNALESVVLGGGSPVLLRKDATAVLRGVTTLQKADAGWRVLTTDVSASKIEPPPPLAINLTTFSSVPAFIVGCSSLLAESPEDYRAHRYLYADDRGYSQCQISVDDQPVLLKVGQNTDPAIDSRHSNDLYTVTVKIEKTIPGPRESQIMLGTMTVQRKNGPTVTIPIYGEGGC